MQPLGCTPLKDSQHQRGRRVQGTDLGTGREGGPGPPFLEAHTYLRYQKVSDKRKLDIVSAYHIM
jgi:hypothetical protein